MFSGIVEEAAPVVNLEKEGGNLHVTMNCSFADQLGIDQSVSHNGVCLTVVDVNKEKKEFTVTAVQETLDKSNLGLLSKGDKVNLERSMKADSFLDGHIVLDRRLANKNHYPPVDVLQSASRLMRQVVDEEHLQYSAQILNVLATYRESEDLVTIGAYTRGTNAALDDALNRIDAVQSFLTQDKDEHFSLEDTKAIMKQVCS